MLSSLLRKTVKPARSADLIEQRTVDVEGRLLPLSIRRNRRATRITLRIEPSGRALSMTVPPGLASREINAFLARYRGWLAVRLAKLAATSTIADGATMPFHGKPHRIVHSGNLRGLTEVAIVDGEEVLSVSGLPEHAGRRIATFLKKTARIELEELARMHARSIQARIGSISIKDTRSRWGSCSSAGNLSFSWRIVMAPPSVIDYLAAHEVAHLKEMNHGPRFWTLCRSLCPHVDEAKAWLKQNGSQLHAIDFD